MNEKSRKDAANSARAAGGPGGGDRRRRLALAMWAAVAIWMAAIFVLSADQAAESEEKSGAVLSLLSGLLSGEGVAMGYDPLDVATVIRKSAHMIEYFVLGLLATTAWAATLKGPIGRAAKGRARRYGAALGIAYAVTDEIHQYFVPGRAAMISDVMLDAVGVFAGAAIAALVCGAVNRAAE
ncbi:MAG: VanZ family protein [Clostridiales bacterium]|jgi:VanZ family protein|nr:VanZ family protein [Clostridiales bacterium]